MIENIKNCAFVRIGCKPVHRIPIALGKNPTLDCSAVTEIGENKWFNSDFFAG